MGHNYEEKRRYKLYKAKKRWVSAAIITASGALLFLGAPSVLADEAVTTEVTTTAENGQQTSCLCRCTYLEPGRILYQKPCSLQLPSHR